jgi:Tfp pilus assembly protein FimT
MAMVIAIMALTAGIAAPRYARSLALYRATAAANRLAADLSLARVSARTTSATRSVDFAAPAVGYTLAGLTDTEHPAATYAVSLAGDQYQVTALTPALAAVGTGSAVTSVGFDRFGAPDAGGTITVQVGDARRIVTVDANTGRATVQ